MIFMLVNSQGARCLISMLSTKHSTVLLSWLHELCNVQWRRSGVFIVKFENISYHALVFLLLTLSR